MSIQKEKRALEFKPKTKTGKIYRSFQDLNTDFMIQQLKEKLWAYIIQNNPDLMYELQEQYGVDTYLDEKVSSVMPTVLKLIEQGRSGYAVQELSMNELTADLKPSRYHYILAVLSEEFESEHEQLKDSGLLSYEAVSMVVYCKPTFNNLNFSKSNEEDKQIHYAITGMIAEYFQHNQAD
jgi:hypothetical protein